MGVELIRLNPWNSGTSGYGSESMWASSSLNWGALATHSNGIGHVKGYLKAGRGIRFTEDTPAPCWEADPHNLGKPLSTISTLKTR